MRPWSLDWRAGYEEVRLALTLPANSLSHNCAWQVYDDPHQGDSILASEREPMCIGANIIIDRVTMR